MTVPVPELGLLHRQWQAPAPERAGACRSRPRPLAVLLTLTGALSMLLFGPAPRADAHTQLLATNPPNGARLTTAPAEITLRFGEAVILVQDGIRLFGPHGPVTTPGPARIDPASRGQVDLPVPDRLGSGVYTVSWRVVSADSHPVYGTFVFGIGDVRIGQLPVAGAQTGSDPSLSAVFLVFRWLGYLALALLAGGASFLLICWPSGWSQPRAQRLLLAAWGGSLVSSLAVLLLQGPNAAGSPLASAFDPALVAATLGTDFGRYVLARIGLVVLGGALSLWLVRAPGSRQRLALAVALTLNGILPATWIGTGHANAGGDLLVAASDVVHLAAMAVWLGGLAFLVLCVLRRSAVVPVAEIGAALTRFSPIAAGSVAALVVTGVYRSWIEVGSPGALVGTGYGKLLVFKLAALGVLLWFAAMSRSVVRRRYAARVDRVVEPDLVAVGTHGASRPSRRHARAAAEQELLARKQLRWTVGAEAGIAVVVLALTSALVATPPGSRPPPGGVRGGDASQSLIVPVTGDWRLRLVVRRPGTDRETVGTTVRVR
jgi:copper transport protein